MIVKRDDNYDARAIMAIPKSRRHNHRTEVKVNSGRIQAEFTYEAPHAARVFLAGDFNRWGAGDLRLRRDQTGTWRIQLWLAPGRYEYRFIVDGEWRDDPGATIRIPNHFGTSNCVLVVS